jgi:hypothetical protein
MSTCDKLPPKMPDPETLHAIAGIRRRVKVNKDLILLVGGLSFLLSIISLCVSMVTCHFQRSFEQERSEPEHRASLDINCGSISPPSDDKPQTITCSLSNGGKGDATDVELWYWYAWEHSNEDHDDIKSDRAIWSTKSSSTNKYFPRFPPDTWQFDISATEYKKWTNNGKLPQVVDDSSHLVFRALLRYRDKYQPRETSSCNYFSTKEQKTYVCNAARNYKQ